ncbi:MAG: type II toxin-antitoxin system Phd/YefM family antitoxin [Hyphomonadaceae bacterium]|nr:type II toxin-antitoxin system Phd/YefM family antitoxin [Hyphomonadaceae bacterium]
MAVWQVQTAKAKFSELLRAAREQGPQTISVRGKEEFVLVDKAAFERGRQPQAAPKTGLDLFRPILGLGVDLEKLIGPRRVDPERPNPFLEEDK